MKLFFNLVGFEYKKIVMRRSFIFALIIMLFVSTLALIGGDLFSGQYQSMGSAKSEYESRIEHRNVVHSKAGFVDDKLLNELLKDNQTAIEIEKVNRDLTYNERLHLHWAYASITQNLTDMLSPIDKYNNNIVDEYTSTDNVDFYKLREQRLVELAKYQNYSEKAINLMQEMNSKISTPFYYDFFDAYRVFLVLMTTSSVFIVFALVICIAPIFADERHKNMNSIILSSKYGKNKLIGAKIFTVLTFSALFTIVAIGIALISLFAVHGTTGWNVSYQIFQIFSVYPINMLQSVLIYCVSIMSMALLMSAICSLMSSKLSSFVSITAILLVLFGTMLLDLQKTPLLNYFLPGKMLDSNFILNGSQVNLFGLLIEPCVFVPIVCIVVMAILFPISYKLYKNSQVS